MTAYNSTARAYKPEPRISAQKTKLALVPKPQNPETVLRRFETYLISQRGLGLTTVGNYISTMRRVFPDLGTRPTPRAVDKHVAAMRKDGKSTSHISNTSIALERYGDFIGVKISLARPKASYKLVQGTLTEAEMARFIGASSGIRERSILALLAYSGGRNNELCNMHVSDLDTKAGRITFRGTKPGKGHTVPIAPACLSLMVEYVQYRNAGPEDFLFVTVRNGNKLQQQDLRKLVRTVAARAGIIKRVYPHLVRHSLGTNLLRRGTGLLAIKEQLGHSFLSTTLRYLHSTPECLAAQYIYNAPAYL